LGIVDSSSCTGGDVCRCGTVPTECNCNRINKSKIKQNFMCGFKLFTKFYVLYVSVNSVNFLCPPSSGFHNDLYCSSNHKGNWVISIFRHHTQLHIMFHTLKCFHCYVTYCVERPFLILPPCANLVIWICDKKVRTL
jgi:hypothetical protein